MQQNHCLFTSFVLQYCWRDLFVSRSSIRDLLQTDDDFTVPGPDRPSPIYCTDWCQKPAIPPRRGKHYNISTVGPPVTTSIYPPTIFFGRLCKILYGKNPIWEIAQSSVDINDYLPICLHPKPLPTLTDHIKHQTLCTKPVVWMIRRFQVQSHPVSQSIDKLQLINELHTGEKYNFVLLGDGRLIFSRIPHKKLKYPYRLLSKHVTLAKHSSNVRFAGEIRITDDRETLFINNSSGTYRPDDRMVFDTVAYLQQLLPHLLIRGISRN